MFGGISRLIDSFIHSFSHSTIFNTVTLTVERCRQQCVLLRSGFIHLQYISVNPSQYRTVQQPARSGVFLEKLIVHKLIKKVLTVELNFRIFIAVFSNTPPRVPFLCQINPFQTLCLLFLEDPL